MNPIVFLDIDGVLTTHATMYNYGDPDCVERLNFLTAYVDAQIVVSSAWRANENINYILPSWGVAARVCGYTPFVTAIKNGVVCNAGRGIEIATWLREHPECERFVILDDERFDMGDLIPWLVQTETQKGLQDEDVEKAVEIIESKRFILGEQENYGKFDTQHETPGRASD